MFVVLLIAAAAAGWWGWQRYQAFADTPVDGLQPGAHLLVERGDSLPVVMRKLRELGVREGHEIEWRMLARELGAGGRLQVGEYALAEGMSPREILIAMRDGRVVRYAFTILPGRNMRELRAALARAEPLLHQSADLDDAALMETLGHPGQHPEGRFLPETYHYTRGDSDLDILRRAHSSMQRALDAAWSNRDPGTLLKSPDEMLIMASIVEKETGIAEERPQIAGVFERRLRIGMRLQTDPTVIYGLGATFDGNIRRRDLVTDTPYNTYTRDGLPPTPIAMPGVEALQAVARPADGDALYFVAVGDGSGRHVFSRTLAEHNAAVAQYLRRYRQARAAERAAMQEAPAVGTGPEAP
ncbi:endolytic transglycosylase MltG [Lysobacter alkalisoli]|uniref:Endolytic murein transglycosylase n=1 Tax=Marilutibacter alkalisoli TaxID=2591633 RepID=A0A514BWP6_9GAMM|nr:endolytic transglycosylase MltG [Lysobacter alkalisoli]